MKSAPDGYHDRKASHLFLGSLQATRSYPVSAFPVKLQREGKNTTKTAAEEMHIYIYSLDIAN